MGECTLDDNLRRCFPVAGMLLVAVVSLMWITSVAADGRWRFGGNSLSDLGTSSSPLACAIFTIGCIVSGALGMVFGAGISRYSGRWNWHRVAGILGACGSFFLIGLAVLPQSLKEPHYFCTGAFAVLFAATMMASAAGDCFEHRYGYSLASTVLVGTCLVLNFSPIDFNYFEPISVILIMTWCLLQSVKYYRIIRQD